jgi:hypothetical protein
MSPGSAEAAEALALKVSDWHLKSCDDVVGAVEEVGCNISLPNAVTLAE